eukprot:9386347-Pyramimonas_sp.AAC.1
MAAEVGPGTTCPAKGDPSGASLLRAIERERIPASDGVKVSLYAPMPESKTCRGTRQCNDPVSVSVRIGADTDDTADPDKTAKRPSIGGPRMHN